MSSTPRWLKKIFDFRSHSRSLMVVIILVVAVGFGFLFDLICTGVEYLTHPKDYSQYVETYAQIYDVPPHIVYAIIDVESGFDSSAVSSAGAVGLMQMMPSTFSWLTHEILFEHLSEGMLYDPETNIRYGTYYLSRLYDRYGDWDVTLAAYNAGPTNVDGWLKDPAYADGEGGLAHIPFKETRNYVEKVNAAMEIYDRVYGVSQDGSPLESEAETESLTQS